MSKRILFSVLNWGLGHTTRSIPVIRQLLARGHEVILASDGMALDFLGAEFPELSSHTLKPYNVEYHSRRLIVNVLSNARRILRAVQAEHEQVRAIATNASIDAVITDNRYGSYVTGKPCAIITHQLKFRTGNPIIDLMAEKRAVRWLKPFDRIWIPDDPHHTLSGILSKTTDNRARYVGWLTTVKPGKGERKYDLLALLSGPEPQRTRLEEIIRPQLANLGVRAVLVRGVRGSSSLRHEDNIAVVDFIDRSGVEETLASSEYVVCRSGYSSLMDLCAAGKKAILIPTPGQPEQEYLGMHMKQTGLFIHQPQSDVDLQHGLAELGHLDAIFPAPGANRLLLNKAIADFEMMMGLTPAGV